MGVRMSGMNGQTEKKGIHIGRKGKLPFFRSMLGQISVTIVLVVIITAVVNLLVIIPNVERIIREQTQNYIYDMTESYGTKMTEKYAMLGEAAFEYDIMSAMLADAGLEGVDSSYVYVVEADGTMLFHPTEEKVGQPVENEVVKGVVEQLSQGKIPSTEVVQYLFKGVTKYAGYYVHPSGKFILVLTADEDEMFAPIDEMTIQAIIGSLIALVICSAVGIMIPWKIVKSIEKTTEVVNQIADMDFRETSEEAKLILRKDESGEISRAIRDLRGNLVDVVGNLQHQTQQLYLASEELSKNASETVETVGQVEHAVQEIATGASSQADETQQATEHVIVMGEMVEDTTQEVNTLHGTMEEMGKAGETAADKLHQLEEINARAKASLDDIYEQTNTTNHSALKIQEVIGIITEIAEETNLLSLNASIEAARAGEQGRGFAVVASQIQKLAEQSNESARKIEEIVTYLISDSKQAVETMDEVKGIMDEQINFVTETADIFRNLQGEIDNSISKIEQISTRTAHLDRERTGVVDVVQNLTAIAEENAASTEETSASVVAVGDIMTQVSKNAFTLKEIADNLEAAMEKFVI
ncbi:MAG: methyl-accepting chemotaxis protein [Lachnospiraceae bacterium]|nr:methyl-accepting chemotaxis protein [Lachnospiraceae bacterium]